MLLPKYSKYQLEAGLDEVGRGCLAGPVVAAAVILKDGVEHEFLNDSKKLTEKKRLLLDRFIKENSVAYAIQEVSPQKIDEINILNASFLAMHRAVDNLSVKPEFLLVDGNRFKPYDGLSHECIVKGDGKYMNIAAASILAKNYRDQLMSEMDQKYPGYDWAKNVGYPTKKHREAIKKLGVTPIHRMSFKLLPNQLELF